MLQDDARRFYYEPNSITTILHPLRRTLVLQQKINVKIKFDGVIQQPEDHFPCHLTKMYDQNFVPFNQQQML